ncbi:MAG: asparaginase [Balneolaceae bacterium]|nr:asparaginase [Balneolaceae bacterium]MBO6547358.1 asparaginase [Balneolaceae bacterium]MBO6647695.1 asparaginase [Balneolaceae bacterium]
MKKILLIQTGGTIAMSAKGEGVELNPEAWSDTLVDRVTELNELAEIQTHPLFFEDSSDLNTSHWKELAKCIRSNYEQYDGFVILHGTDTMAYTASALSFALMNLAKPVILTGSQVPLSSIRSDARRNLINSVEMATTDLHEVAICFNDHVYRGNRTTKLSIGDFDAFGSPNFPIVAEIGLNIEMNSNLPTPAAPLDVQPKFDNSIVVLTVFPSLNTDFLMKLDLSKLKAIIVRSFGSGNFPMKGEFSLLPFLKKCKENDVIVVFISQADYDAVDLTKYPAGRKALEVGAISGGDMTLEAALTKMMWLLGNYEDSDIIKKLYLSSLAGELSSN